MPQEADGAAGREGGGPKRVRPARGLLLPGLKRWRIRRGCFYCLEGWVFLGSIGPDGEEVYEALRCRRCGGTGRH